jgi:hypothetical protein
MSLTDWRVSFMIQTNVSVMLAIIFKYHTYSDRNQIVRLAYVTNLQVEGKRIYQRFSNCGPPPRGALFVLWGARVFLYDGHTYFERNMGAT